MDKAAPPSFLSLPSEIRVIIYRESFSRRGLVLTRRVTRLDRWGGKSKVDGIDYCVDNPGYERGSTIPLLQTCKQIFAEAQPIHSQCAPSHLLLDKEYGQLPYLPQIGDLEIPLGVPVAYITHLTFHATSLGPNRRRPRECPGPETDDPEYFTLTNCRVDDVPTSLLKRLPNLKGICELTSIINKGLPALREVHIQDVLEYSIKGLSEPCKCAKAGTSSCTCGQCTCTCAVVAPIIGADTDSPSETKQQLHEDLRARYRAALPTPIDEQDSPTIRDWAAMLQLLERGTHFYLHDKIVPTNLSNPAALEHKRVWSTTYHLAPPVIEDGQGPAEPPTESIESPRKRRLEGRAHVKPYSDEFELDFSTLENADVLENFDFDSYLNQGAWNMSPPSIAEEERIPFTVTKPLVDFEDCLRIELVDEIF